MGGSVGGRKDRTHKQFFADGHESLSRRWGCRGEPARQPNRRGRMRYPHSRPAVMGFRKSQCPAGTPGPGAPGFSGRRGRVRRTRTRDETCGPASNSPWTAPIMSRESAPGTPDAVADAARDVVPVTIGQHTRSGAQGSPCSAVSIRKAQFSLPGSGRAPILWERHAAPLFQAI